MTTVVFVVNGCHFESTITLLSFVFKSPIIVNLVLVLLTRFCFSPVSFYFREVKL